jgi:D-xylose 1-dehydrogenase (NADP+, D-xylono-1,5-lactone-forming)
MIRWGLLSPSRIAEVMLETSKSAPNAEVVAVASRDPARAGAFAAEHGLQAFGSYEALLASDAVDAIYVPLPNALHAEWATKALEAGKHVLCEKPLSRRPADVAAAFDAADRSGRILAEAFMYRYHPATALARRLLSEGAIGELAYLKVTLSFTMEGADVRLSKALDGGSLMDLGCYCVNAARLFAGEPDRVYAEEVRAGEEVDMQMAGTLRCGDVLAQFDCGFALPRRDRLELVGSAGELHLGDPWLCREPALTLIRDGCAERVPVEGPLTFEETEVYGIELDTISATIEAGRELPYGREDSLGQARALDALLRSAELGHPIELLPEPVT